MSEEPNSHFCIYSNTLNRSFGLYDEGKPLSGLIRLKIIAMDTACGMVRHYHEKQNKGCLLAPLHFWRNKTLKLPDFSSSLTTA